jgi:hypothetical protein
LTIDFYLFEEITDEAETVSSENLKSTSTEYQVKQPRESADISKSGKGGRDGSSATNSEPLEALKDDPEAMRLFLIHLKIA